MASAMPITLCHREGHDFSRANYIGMMIEAASAAPSRISKHIVNPSEEDHLQAEYLRSQSRIRARL
jgi:hypothetical protein